MSHLTLPGGIKVFVKSCGCAFPWRVAKGMGKKEERGRRRLFQAKGAACESHKAMRVHGKCFGVAVWHSDMLTGVGIQRSCI